MSGNIIFLGKKIFENPPFFQTRPGDLGRKVHACSLRFSALKPKGWFSLAHKHKHKDIRTRRMAHLSQFSIPALLYPMINKMLDEAYAILLLICSHEVWVKMTYDWFTACTYACAYVDPVFFSQSYDIRISTTTRRTNPSVFLVVMLMLMSTQFSLAYKLYMCLCLCLCLRASENRAKERPDTPG